MQDEEEEEEEAGLNGRGWALNGHKQWHEVKKKRKRKKTKTGAVKLRCHDKKSHTDHLLNFSKL